MDIQQKHIGNKRAEVDSGTKRAIIPAVLKTISQKVIFTPLELAAQLMEQLGVFVKWERQTKYYINQKIAQMLRQGLIEFKQRGDKKFLTLTKRGQQKLLRYQVQTTKTKRWDGKWRVIIFDIREKSRRQRDQLRFELKNFGCRQLQKSVWVTPYDCAELILLLKADLGLGYNVLYLEVDYLENEKKLRNLFGL